MKPESRRRFLKTVPAVVAGAVAGKAYAQGPGAQNSGPVKPETIEAAESIIGVDFHREDETAIANGLNNRLRTLQQLRQSEIPVETEPAIMFKPSLPGREPKGPATPLMAIDGSPGGRFLNFEDPTS